MQPKCRYNLLLESNFGFRNVEGNLEGVFTSEKSTTCKEMGTHPKIIGRGQLFAPVGKDYPVIEGELYSESDMNTLNRALKT